MSTRDDEMQTDDWVDADPPPEESEPEKPKKERKPKYPVLAFEDETVVGAPGLGLHVIKDGKRCWVPDTWTQAYLGIRMDYVVMLFPEQLLAIPEGPAIPTRIPH